MRNDPERFLERLQQTRLADCLLSDNYQFDGGVDDWVFLKRAEILAHVSGTLREVRGDVDERVAGKRDSAQSAQSGQRHRQLRQFVVMYSQVFQ